LKNNSAIGGYMELELQNRGAYHKNLLALNTGRNALKYLLEVYRPSRIFIPRYICQAVLQPIKALGIKYEYYSITEELDPIGLETIDSSELVLYVNYFGLKGAMARRLSARINNLVIDNTQAFFAEPETGVPAFYSARKFFGVPDGAYLYTPRQLELELEKDHSDERFSHLLKRLELGAEAGFEDYKNNENRVSGLELRRMSNSTQKILESIDYEHVKHTRVENYRILHEYLGSINQAKFVALDNESVPLAYPFMYSGCAIRSVLLQKQIYCPEFWPNVIESMQNGPESVECRVTKYTTPLPIDQRYGVEEMQYIAKMVIEAVNYG
jgi:hypothetical protein